MEEIKQNNDGLVVLGEAIYNIALMVEEGSLITISSDNEDLTSLNIDQINNGFKQIVDNSDAISNFQEKSEETSTGRRYFVYSMKIDTLSFRDYLIDLYGNKNGDSIQLLQEKHLDQEVLYWVTFKADGDVILNDKYLMCILQYGGQPYEVFEYIFKHTGHAVTKKQIEKKHSIEITQSFSNIINDIGFNFGLKKIFFKSSRNKIIMRNHVTRGQVKELGVLEADLLRQVESFKKLG